MRTDKKSGETYRESGLQSFLALRTEAKQNGIQDLSLQEINGEIYEARMVKEESLQSENHRKG